MSETVIYNRKKQRLCAVYSNKALCFGLRSYKKIILHWVFIRDIHNTYCVETPQVKGLHLLQHQTMNKGLA